MSRAGVYRCPDQRVLRRAEMACFPDIGLDAVASPMQGFRELEGRACAAISNP